MLNDEYTSDVVSRILLGIQPDTPVITNDNGGKQSDSPCDFTLIPPVAMFAAARVCKHGAEKYGEKLEDRNYLKIPWNEHLSHCLAHIYAYLDGDTSDEHLAHALVRMMFAYDCWARDQKFEVKTES